MGLLKLDLHVHTHHSPDAFTEPRVIPEVVKRKGLDGLAITNHDLLVRLEIQGMIVIPGMEISTAGGHIIALGIDEPITKGLTPEETVEKIHGMGGVAIIPHPYDLVSPSVNPRALRVRPEALETINADALLFRLSKWLAERAARELGLPAVAGSDSHIPETIGDAYTLVEASDVNVDDILEAISKGRVTPKGHPTPVINKVRKAALQLWSRTLRRFEVSGHPP